MKVQIDGIERVISQQSPVKVVEIPINVPIDSHGDEGEVVSSEPCHLTHLKLTVQKKDHHDDDDDVIPMLCMTVIS